METGGQKELHGSDLEATISEQAHEDEVIFDKGPPRTLHMRSIIAAAFNICNSWAGIAATLFLGITVGGPVTVIYGIVLSTTMVGCCVLSMAELAARYPTAGGQYHWTWLLAPTRVRWGMSYTTGMINIFAWTATSAAVCAIIPSITLGLAKYWYPLYLSHRWQYFLIYQASNIAVLIYNVGILRRAAWTHDIGMALSLFMMLTYFIVCLVRASPKLPSAYVWTEFVNSETGWSNGIVFLTGLVNANFGFVGIDGAIHLAEDARNAATAVPWALATTVVIGFVTAFPFVVAMFYCITDPALVLASPVPIFEIWRQAVRSDQAATAMTALLVLTGYFALNASQQTASRLTWSFARDRGLLFSEAIGTIHPVLGVPVWALIANAAVVFIMGCVYLGSTTAFNAIVATSLILMHVSFAIPAALKLIRGRSPAFLPETSSRHCWNLGLSGWLFDSITVAWGFVVLIFYCFPNDRPTTGSNANYAAAVLAVMAIFGAINWFAHAKKHYRGPRINLERFLRVKGLE